MAAEYTKWKGPEPRPYYAKYKKLTVKNDCGSWFECYELPGDITAICEPQLCRRSTYSSLRAMGKP